MTSYLCEHLLTSAGWASPGHLEHDAAGTIVSAGPARPHHEGERLAGYVIPTALNLHSHAFQRALVGRTEHRPADRRSDSFWTWRTAMYDLALRITPEDLEAIAAQLYVEMLEAGMSAVGEFHYLHHPQEGGRYAELAETSQRILSAAQATGISLTLLPVAYLRGGFGMPPQPQQRRFACADPEEVLKLRAAAQHAARALPHTKVGLAPHSLRAVSPQDMQALLQGLVADSPQARVHVHVAEQALEVQQCEQALGARPVRWLLDNTPLDARWCAVHATHLDAGEVKDLARCGAVAGLCPTTEANLGDGLFSGPAFWQAGGSFGIGSDSQVCVSATEELRLLEYGQRLSHQQRNLLVDPSEQGSLHIGQGLWSQACAGGAQALDQPIGRLEAGRRADFIVLDAQHPRLMGHGPQSALDAFIFGGADRAIDQVFVAGRRWVQGGHHVHAAEIRARFSTVMRRLYEA